MSRPLYAFALIAVAAGCHFASAQSVSAASCSRAKTKTLKECNTKINTDRAAEDLKTSAKSAECKKSNATSQCARDLSALSGSAATKNAEAIKECTDKKKSCEQECDEGKIGVEFLGAKRQAEAEKVKKTKKECVDEFDKLLGKLGTEAGQASGSQAGGTETADSSKGSGENKEQAQQQPQQQPQQAQQPQQSQSSPSSSPPQTPQTPQAQTPAATEAPKAEADPCNGANANLYSQCKAKIAERCASQSPGAVGFGTPDPSCAAAKSGKATAALSPTCARFKQQCASNTAGCLKSMSATEQAKIQSECLGADAKAAEGISSGTAGFQTASAGTPVSSGGGHGGGSGGSSVGTSTGATLTDEYEKLKKQYESMGAREGTGDNLRVDSGGGYSGEGGGGGSSSEASPMGMGRAKPSSVERTIASQSVPNSANATDVDGRYGRSVFSISTDVLKARCAKGRLLHCAPELK